MKKSCLAAGVDEKLGEGVDEEAGKLGAGEAEAVEEYQTVKK